ncbi:MAG TPA: SAM-dependent methyltransferase [Pseudonocardiaceae bacterium]|nr:SAM-dependent methyltransferase [Pseudonocardiaceae bacterium]
MDISQINAIGRTAWEVAALRAAEHERPDRLFADPYAARCLEAAGVAAEPDEAKRDLVAILSGQVAVRTRFLDETLLGGGCRQVVLLASGMDSRAGRLEWPAGTEIFELDQEPVLRFKQEVMGVAIPHPVGVDLREDWSLPLRQAGFRPDLPTAWLVEGLLYALDEAAADQLLATVSGLSASGSVLGFDHVQDSAALRAALVRIGPGLAALWRSGPVDPSRWLRRFGWAPDVHELAEVAGWYGRAVHPSYDPAIGGAHSWLGRATRL